MARGYGRAKQRTIAALTRQYCADLYELGETEVDQVVDHSEKFFVLLPLRMRLVVGAVLRIFSMWGRLKRPFGRSLTGKSLADQRRVYDAWCGGKSYLAYLRRQMIHLSFVGSLYSHPSVQKAIGYDKVREFNNQLAPDAETT